MNHLEECFITSQDERIVRKAHDGVWKGKRYYDCEPNKGMFVPMKNLKPFNEGMKKRRSAGTYIYKMYMFIYGCCQ